MKHKLTHNLVSQSVSQSVSHSLVDSKFCVKSENAVEIC
nr:MAG TPA: hypothetical protein [Caudoviricetes sp.]